MFNQMTAAAVIVLIASASAAPNLWAQRGGMHEQPPDSMPGMMGDRIGQGMMGGMMGQGMMGPGMMQMMGQGMGMMATGGPGPAAILRMGDALGLTDAQRTRLQQIQDDFSGSMTNHMNAAMPAHTTAQQALHGDTPDFDEYEDALREVADHMVQAHLNMARAAAEARGLLTEEQREQLQQGMGMMQGMMGGPGMGGGMKGQPGMEHGRMPR